MFYGSGFTVRIFSGYFFIGSSMQIHFRGVILSYSSTYPMFDFLLSLFGFFGSRFPVWVDFDLRFRLFKIDLVLIVLIEYVLQFNVTCLAC